MRTVCSGADLAARRLVDIRNPSRKKTHLGYRTILTAYRMFVKQSPSILHKFLLSSQYFILPFCFILFVMPKNPLEIPSSISRRRVDRLRPQDQLIARYFSLQLAVFYNGLSYPSNFALVFSFSYKIDSQESTTEKFSQFFTLFLYFPRMSDYFVLYLYAF